MSASIRSATALLALRRLSRPTTRFERPTRSSFLAPLDAGLPAGTGWGTTPAGTRSIRTTTDGAQVGGNRRLDHYR